MEVGSSSYPHTPKGWPKGEWGKLLGQNHALTSVPPPGAVAPQQILPGYGSRGQDFWTKGYEAGGVWDPTLDSWHHVPVPQRQILRGTWKNVPDSGKGDTGN